MSRKVFIAGNWKMNKTAAETVALCQGLKEKFADICPCKVDVAVCPPFTSIATAIAELKGSNIKVGAQNIHWADNGAFTGEISGAMLKEMGVEYVIIGHSERRQYFGETDETVNKRIQAALKYELKPIVCIGETLEEREGNKTEAVLEKQIKGAFAGISADDFKKIVIAYEPVWAIGTGRTATADQAQEVCAAIRKVIGELYGEAVAKATTVQYGGSMNDGNAAELLSKPDVDGGLIGGAALKAEKFAAIVKAATEG